MRLYGRIHVDENNTFIIKESGFDGFIEIARTCRVPLHTAARFSIGSSMSSIQFYQAIKDDILLPRNKKIPETFKSALDLLVGDRGGFIFEPRLGVHDRYRRTRFLLHVSLANAQIQYLRRNGALQMLPRLAKSHSRLKLSYLHTNASAWFPKPSI